MYFNEEQLKDIEEMAFRLFSPEEIALAMELDNLADEFLEDCRTPGTPAHRAYFKGYLRQVASLREDTIKAARNGSNPAQEELARIAEELGRALRYG